MPASARFLRLTAGTRGAIQLSGKPLEDGALFVEVSWFFARGPFNWLVCARQVKEHPRLEVLAGDELLLR